MAASLLGGRVRPELGAVGRLGVDHPEIHDAAFVVVASQERAEVVEVASVLLSVDLDHCQRLIRRDLCGLGDRSRRPGRGKDREAGEVGLAAFDPLGIGISTGHVADEVVGERASHLVDVTDAVGR